MARARRPPEASSPACGRGWSGARQERGARANAAWARAARLQQLVALPAVTIGAAPDRNGEPAIATPRPGRRACRNWKPLRWSRLKWSAASASRALAACSASAASAAAASAPSARAAARACGLS